MANLTITVDDEVLRRARIRALELGTSVSALLQEYLAELTEDGERRRRAVERLLELPAGHSGGWKWNRDELYDRRVLQPHGRGDGERDGSA